MYPTIDEQVEKMCHDAHMRIAAIYADEQRNIPLPWEKLTKRDRFLITSIVRSILNTIGYDFYQKTP